MGKSRGSLLADATVKRSINRVAFAKNKLARVPNSRIYGAILGSNKIDVDFEGKVKGKRE